jgi:hypothetical protein
MLRSARTAGHRPVLRTSPPVRQRGESGAVFPPAWAGEGREGCAALYVTRLASEGQDERVTSAGGVWAPTAATVPIYVGPQTGVAPTFPRSS